MKTVKDSSKLNIISEVLLEIRFTPNQDISLIVGRLYEKLRDKYPEFKNLNIPDFPGNIPEFDKIVKYRFYSADKKELYNLGKGILSINTLKYSGFADFQKQSEAVLKLHKELSGLPTITRIGLRYINKIPFINEGKQIFNIKFSLPDLLNRIEKGFNYKSIGKNNDTVLITSLFTEPFSKKTITLDFDCYITKETSYDVSNILTWSKESYKFIKEAFNQSLTSALLKNIVIEV